MVKSVVEIEINAPQATAAALFADPGNMTTWMDDLGRVEAIGGEMGMPGSTYRLVPKSGNMIFVATVRARDLPNESRVTLDASNVAVSVKGTFRRLATNRTLLISEEEFRFKGLINAAFGFLAQRSIRSTHRRHIEAFKRFADAHGSRDKGERL